MLFTKILIKTELIINLCFVKIYREVIFIKECIGHKMNIYF